MTQEKQYTPTLEDITVRFTVNVGNTIQADLITPYVEALGTGWSDRYVTGSENTPQILASAPVYRLTDVALVLFDWYKAGRISAFHIECYN